MAAALSALKSFFTSLRLTVVLLGFSIVLVFLATWMQQYYGIHYIEQEYFHAFIAPIRAPNWNYAIPIPGGYLLGWLLFVNLLVSQLMRIPWRWSKVGLHLSHAGILLLLLGEFFRGISTEESQMFVDEGATSNYSESIHARELAVVDITDPKLDVVTAIPLRRLERGEVVTIPNSTLSVQPRQFFANAQLAMRRDAPNAPANPSTAGVGPQVVVMPTAETFRPNEMNFPTGYVELRAGGQSLGVYLVSLMLERPQQFTHAGRTYELSLRSTRHYQDFSLTLLDFRHDKYPGTEIPKNFSSQVRILSEDGRENREVRIYMNNPLRLRGLTFYQASFANHDTTSIFQVVRNPGWTVPYLACLIAWAGLSIHFIISLVGFVARPRRTSEYDRPKPRSGVVPPEAGRASSWVPIGTCVLVLSCCAYTLRVPSDEGSFNVEEFGRLPVLVGGRIKPLDTVARTTLLFLQNKQDYSDPSGVSLRPTEWLLDVLYRPEIADTYRHFRIDNPETLALFGLTEDDTKISYDKAGDRTRAALGFKASTIHRFSFRQLERGLPELIKQAEEADKLDNNAQTPFQREVVTLRQRVTKYQRLKHSLTLPQSPDFAAFLDQFVARLPAGLAATQSRMRNEPHDEAAFRALAESFDLFEYLEQNGELRPIPPADSDPQSEHWTTVGTALKGTFSAGQIEPHVAAYARLARAYRAQDVATFNRELAQLRGSFASRFQPQFGKAAVEFRFNHAQPFYLAMTLSVFAFCAAVGFWILRRDWARTIAFGLGASTLILTLLGVVTRAYIDGRPPVTNLYSAALFVGLVSMVLGLLVECFYRKGIGIAASSMIAFGTLLIAHHLSFDGDTIEMMRAVLDDNFWLATHVLVITAGYGAMFLAGFIGALYVFLGVFTKYLTKELAQAFAGMAYGAVCFATLFSLVGTILGGIWADQSWGRFWGWDPKENGALIIVLWCAIVLHARWGGIVKQRGTMLLAIFGNVVTSWSFFGVNLLGVGLHSYGFATGAFTSLITFMGGFVALILIGLIPLEKWRSPMVTPPAAPPPTPAIEPPPVPTS